MSVKKRDDAEVGKKPWEIFDEEIFPYLSVERLFGDLRALRRDGRFWQAYCPIHADRQDAFSIDPERLEWNCFSGCGGGGPVQYLQCVRGLSWMDATRELALLAGVDPEILEVWGEVWTEEDFVLHDHLERRSSLLGIFMAYARSNFHSQAGDTLRSYLISQQGFSERKVGELDLGLYSAPEDVWHYLKRTGRELEEVRTWGLFDPKWTGCILGGWKDLQGRIINIWGWQPRETPNRGTRFEGCVLFEEDDLLGGKGIPFNLDAASREEQCKLLLVEEPLTAVLLHSLGLENPFPLATGGDLNSSQIEAIQDYLRLGGELTLCWNYDPYSHGTKLDRSTRTLERLKAANFPIYVMDPGLMADSRNPKRRIMVGEFILARGRGKEGLLVFESLLDKREVQVAVQAGFSENDGQDWPGSFEIFRGFSGRSFRARTGEPGDEAGGYPHLLETLFKAADEMGRRVANGFLKALPTGLLNGLTGGAASGLELASHVVGELPACTTRSSTPAFSVRRLEEETRAAPVGRCSGWQALDSVGVCFNPGELVVVVGRMAHGKTSVLLGLLLEWLHHRSEEPKKELFLWYSMEEPEVRLYHRLLSLLTAREGQGWTIQQVQDYLRKQGNLPFEDQRPDLEVLKQARERLLHWEECLHIIYQPAWTVVEMEAHARQLAQTAAVGGIFVDHLQRLTPPKARPGGPTVAHRLKALAVELSCPVVATAQIGPEPPESIRGKPPEKPFENGELQEAIRRHRPQLHHLREEEIAQEADLVLGLLNYVAEYRAQGAHPEEITLVTPFEVGMLKNRYGSVGCWVVLGFEAQFGLVRDPSSADL